MKAQLTALLSLGLLSFVVADAQVAEQQQPALLTASFESDAPTLPPLHWEEDAACAEVLAEHRADAEDERVWESEAERREAMAECGGGEYTSATSF